LIASKQANHCKLKLTEGYYVSESPHCNNTCCTVITTRAYLHQ